MFLDSNSDRGLTAATPARPDILVHLAVGSCFSDRRTSRI
jgi:hypothetical protein